jgi:RNA polymerase sigma-70 factor (ECF subfamily)
VFHRLLGGALGAAYQVALNLTGRRDAAEALVEEAAARAFPAFGALEPDADFRVWFLGILVDVFLSRYAGGAASAAEPGGRPMPLDQLDPEGVVAAIHALPVEYRLPTALYFADHLRYEEIGSALRIPLGAVRARLHRGRRLLRRRLTGSDAAAGRPALRV